MSFFGVPNGLCRTIVADPPWPYQDAGKKFAAIPKTRGQTRVNDFNYETMSVEDIASLPVDELAATPAHLYLWTTNAFMVEAHAVMEAWGFTQKTILTWVKVKKDDPTVPSMKTGYYFRGATEHVLFGVRGSQRLTTSRGIPTAFLTARTPHSVKPDDFFEIVEEASPAPRIELFARSRRPGWLSWGNQLPEPKRKKRKN